MSGNLLNTSSTLQCPHGGSVSIVSANTRVKADGAFAALSTDTFTISGCPFQIPAAPSPIPSPCVTVKWVVTNLRTQTNRTPNLSQSCVGICQSAAQIPQGPVVIANTQTKASGM
jgi:hypothetical protein